MAIVEMSKITLLGIQAEKEKLLDCLFASKIVELKNNVEPLVNTSKLFDENKFETLDLYCSKLERAISTIEENLPVDTKIENVFDVNVNDFKALEDKKPEIENILHELDIIQGEKSELKKDKSNLQNKLNMLLPYQDVKEKFNDFKSTKHVTILLGIISNSNLKELDKFLEDYNLSNYEVCGLDNNVIKVYSHNSESGEVIKKLNELGFSKCVLNLDVNAKTAIKEVEQQLLQIEKADEKIKQKYKSFIPVLKDLKIMRDYVKFCLEKIESENNINSTREAFILEGFLAKENEKKLEETLNKLNLNIEYDFSKPTKDEMPPTITQNNKIVGQFEFVTNMYSAPNYKELDPNLFIAIFFSLFFGFIMADVGYGLVLTVLGFILAKKQVRPTGFKKLMSVISIGGIATITFGVLFGSFFGVVLPCFTLSGSTANLIKTITVIVLAVGIALAVASIAIKIIQKKSRLLDVFSIIGFVLTLVGVVFGAFVGVCVPVGVLPNPVSNVITMLVACLAAGVVQIMVSFILKGILLIKRKRILEAIFSAFTWDFFFVGLALFLLEFANIYVGLGTVGIVIAILSVAITVVGLASINKGFDRVSKSFGAVYGIINLFSDILSYARLFGLMLSGAIIASIVNQLAGGFLLSPVTFVIGAIILFIGHAFNLAMGALGAYIHVARLQYIEFFSRFYEGEGELFVPFGQTNFQYVNLI